MPFTCDFCGISGDHSPYLCTKCNLVVHKKCISMPRSLMITRHPHMISHSYSLPQNDVRDSIWDGTIVLEDNDESCKETQHASLNLITDVVEQTSIGEQMIYHVWQPLIAWYKNDRHPLTLTYSDDSSPSQYYCDLCENERNPND
ncbi:uncharacterized protein LOC120142785 [Hibiscus syriacus]|uniref:uncharacterized protein LOC120142785 n=1 Tax=Hibiscus syriacus TaxID=106335 RepID=UPI001920DA2C|nr:uncharacterized protein LOC120142785 [Hibiscus syriacus]